MMKKKLKTLLKYTATLTVLVLIFRKVDLGQLKGALEESSPYLIGLAFASLLAILFFPSGAIQVLFRASGMSLSLIQTYEINLRSMAYSLVIPGDVASGFVRLLAFARAAKSEVSDIKVRMGTSAVVIAADRLLSILALLVVALFCMGLSPLPPKLAPLFRSAVFLGLGALVLGAVLYFMPWRRSLERFFHLNWLERAFEASNRVLSALSRKTLGTAFGFYSLHQAAALFFVDIVLAQAIGLDLPWFQFAAVVAMVRILRFLPITLGGIGVREGLYPLLLAPLGVSFEKSVLLGSLTSLLIIALGLVGAFFELMARREKPSL